jgi:deazaflavin-dependent oxidoreductase (nitroreductase family)
MLKRIFWILNKFLMVPIFRLGLGPLLGSPFGGYIMVLKPIGRKSGKTYYTPVNYAIRKGRVYCVSGGRRKADWFRNLLAHPEIEIILPGGAIFARAEEVSDPVERREAARQVLINAGFAGFFEGYNPRSTSDAALEEKISDLPVLRFTPLGVGNGAFDPGGWAWIWGVLLTLWVGYRLASRRKDGRRSRKSKGR